MKRLISAGVAGALIGLLVPVSRAHAVEYEPCAGCDSWNHHSAFYEDLLDGISGSCFVDKVMQRPNNFETETVTDWKVARWEMPSYPCIRQIAAAFENEYPDRVEVIDIGMTHGDPAATDAYERSPKPITAIRIGTGDLFPVGHERAGQPKPVVLFDADIHGNERETVRILLDWMDYLLNPDNEYDESDGAAVRRLGYPGAPADFTFSTMLEERVIWVVPSVNPDSLNQDRRRNGNHVDLARNFMWGWFPKTDTDKYDEHGKYPLSEPESVALARLAEMIQPSVHLHMHGWRQGGLVGFEDANPEDDYLDGFWDTATSQLYHEMQQKLGSGVFLHEVTPGVMIPIAGKGAHWNVTRTEEPVSYEKFPREDAMQYVCRNTGACPGFGVSLPALAETEQETNMITVSSDGNEAVIRRHLGERNYAPFEYGNTYDTYAHYNSPDWKGDIEGRQKGDEGQAHGHLTASLGTLSILYEIPRFDNDTDAHLATPGVSVNTPYVFPEKIEGGIEKEPKGSFIWGIHRDEEIIQMLIRDSFYPMNRLVLDAANPIPQARTTDTENDVAISAVRMSAEGCSMDYTANYEQIPGDIFTPPSGYFGRRDVACTATNYGAKTSGPFSIDMRILEDGVQAAAPSCDTVTGLGVGQSKTCTLAGFTFLKDARYQVICEVAAQDLDIVEAGPHRLHVDNHEGCAELFNHSLFTNEAELEAVRPDCVWDSTNNEWDAVFQTNNRRTLVFDAVLNQYAVCDFAPWDDRIDMYGDISCALDSDCDDGVPCTDDVCDDGVCQYDMGTEKYEAERIPNTTGGSHPGGWNLWDSNGYLSFTHPFVGGLQQLVVTAAAQEGAGWPEMRVTVGGVSLPVTRVTDTAWTDYEYFFNAPVGDAEVRIYFINDYYQPPVDRNLFVDKITVPCIGGGLDTLVSRINVFNDWGSGYCANLEVTNLGPTPTVDWNVVIDSLDSDIYQSWNTSYISGTGIHTLDTVGWNAVLAPGSTYTSTGFCANRVGSGAAVPVIISDEVVY